MSEGTRASPAVLRFEGVELGYPDRPRVLCGLDFEVREGSFLGIVGANGAGKSTLLKAALGLLRPSAGRIMVGRGGRLLAGYVPQRQALDPLFPLRVADVVVMGLYGRLGPVRRPGRRSRSLVDEALVKVGIAELAGRMFRDLSGGQQQRALVARALVANPDVLVLDEPTNGLDLVGEHGMMELVARFHRDGKTVLIVSHLLNAISGFVEDLAIIHRGRLEVGEVDAMLTSERLSRLYAMPVCVASAEGQKVVLPRPGPREASGPDARGGLS